MRDEIVGGRNAGSRVMTNAMTATKRLLAKAIVKGKWKLSTPERIHLLVKVIVIEMGYQQASRPNTMSALVQPLSSSEES